jgi:hypothetical protein
MTIQDRIYGSRTSLSRRDRLDPPSKGDATDCECPISAPSCPQSALPAFTIHLQFRQYIVVASNAVELSEVHKAGPRVAGGTWGIES